MSLWCSPFTHSREYPVTKTAMDCIAFGVILYFMVGLAATVQNFFIFLAMLFVFSIYMNELLFIFATVAKTKSDVQVISACLLFFFMLFCGFIIDPDTIPNYYSWIYWWNPMAWAYRALIVNQYRSSEYTEEEGDSILTFAGFVDASGNPFGVEWVAYGFAYLLSSTVLCMALSALGLNYVRPSADTVSSNDVVDCSEPSDDGNSDAILSFRPVTLTFDYICYDVKASTSNDQLRLLHDVNGAFKSGRLCALMGSSGAGKTTLMVRGRRICFASPKYFVAFGISRCFFIDHRT
jgi:ABC-type multidrug transport system fused ATPase/permease subunit